MVPCFFSQKIRREHGILARKPRYPADRAKDREFAAGRRLPLDKKPQVAHSGNPKALPDSRIPRGMPRLSCQNRLPGVFFFGTVVEIGPFQLRVLQRSSIKIKLWHIEFDIDPLDIAGHNSRKSTMSRCPVHRACKLLLPLSLDMSAVGIGVQSWQLIDNHGNHGIGER